MNDQNCFWQPIDLIVDLFTNTASEICSAAMIITAAYIVNDRGLF